MGWERPYSANHELLIRISMADELNPADSPLSLTTSPASEVIECKGMRPTSSFPADLTGLSRDQIEHHYRAMRNSHASLTRSRGQLLRRSREFREARDRFYLTLQSYEQRLMVIGQEKAEALQLAQELHRELEDFDNRQKALDRLLDDLETAKEESGFWSIFQISTLIDRMRALLRGARPATSDTAQGDE